MMKSFFTEGAFTEGVMYVVLVCAFFGTRALRVRCCALIEETHQLQRKVEVLQESVKLLKADQDKLSNPEQIKRLIVKLKLNLKPVE